VGEKPKEVRLPYVTVISRTPVRWHRISGVWRPRLMMVTVVGVILMVLLAALNIGRGEYPISVLDVLRVLAGGGTSGQQFVIMDLRLPRSLTAVLVGAALALSGALTQTVARNPLASPDILGVTGGASAAAVVVIVLSGSIPAVAVVAGAVGLPLAALAGGLGTALLIYLLSWRGGIQGFRLVLIGVGIGAIMDAVISWLLVYANIWQASKATVWLTGSLNGRDWDQVVPVGIALALLLPFALVRSFGLGALQLGDDTANGLGVQVFRERTLTLLVAAGLAAIATASAGPIGFVALVVPQVVLRLAGTARPPLLASAVYGSVLVLAADVVARVVLPDDLPVGLVTAVIGAPYLIWLLIRTGRRVGI
jgi:iron complex transport system permease protein